jgi:DNA-binding LacI/PurR family transcriptional regulator
MRGPREDVPPRPTLADVAAAAGVSPATASRALGGARHVSAATREQVWAAARRLAFEPNHAARSLRTRSSMLVGVLIADIAVASYASMVKGAQGALEAAGYQLLVMNTEREAERERAALRTLAARHVDGLLVATSGGFVEDDVPVVFFDHVLDGVGAGYAAADNHGGMATLVRHLAEVHGHERIAYVGAPLAPGPGVAPLEHGSASERLEGLRDAMGALRLPVRPEYLVRGDYQWSAQSAEPAVRELLALPEPPTAIIAASDTLALGALRALRGEGARVPDDVALVSFDDPASGDLLDPPITALARHYGALGELAAGILLRVLRKEAGAGRPSAIRVPLELIVRASCGCGGQR